VGDHEHAAGNWPNTMLHLDHRGRAAGACDVLDDVWLETLGPPAPFGLAAIEQVFPYGGSRRSSHPGWNPAWRPRGDDVAAEWPPMTDRAPIRGRVHFGVPSRGDFVQGAEVGMGYVSPGYDTDRSGEPGSVTTLPGSPLTR
jgi:hypothetical protein